MTRLRANASLRHIRSDSDVIADFVAIGPAVAAQEIDLRWWGMPPGSTHGTGEEDSHWVWQLLCEYALGSSYREATGLRTPDGLFQGAMIYSTDAESVLEPNSGAVYVDYIATAPWNRRGVTDSPTYRAVGSELLCQAAHHSHLLGLRGRVTLASLPGALRFYRERGFLPTGDAVEGMPLLELPPDRSRAWLIEKGLIGNV